MKKHYLTIEYYNLHSMYGLPPIEVIDSYFGYRKKVMRLFDKNNILIDMEKSIEIRMNYARRKKL